VLAAGAQTLRNATQRDLTTRIGPIGATHVRFVFGMPFGVLLLVVALIANRAPLPPISLEYLVWTAAGGGAQIVATALMLKAMTSTSFVVTTAYTKTEPVQAALFGLVFLGDLLTPLLTLAILVATSGVMILGWPQRSAGGAKDMLAPALLGLSAGAFFALSAVFFRGAIHELEAGNAWVRASTTLAFGLVLQTLAITAYLLARDRALLKAILMNWRPSLAAGFLGAAASQFWYLGFALTSVARVRTLALIEVLFAYAISGRVFKERLKRREVAGLALVVVGVALALNS
jgi:drug/metabolite transporter (DMT)-like permease